MRVALFHFSLDNFSVLDFFYIHHTDFDVVNSVADQSAVMGSLVLFHASEQQIMFFLGGSIKFIVYCFR